MNLLFKTLLLTYYFVRVAFIYDRKSIIIANCEIPELLAAWVLKLRNKNVYCVLQDDRVRNNSIYSRVVCKIRIFLIYRIKKVLFTNTFTMNRFDNTIHKIYLGNPIFAI